MHEIINWLLTWTGSNNTSGIQYGFWSGFGSDIGEITILVAVIGWWRHNECHVDGCHRLGRHTFRQYKLCARHHPGVPAKVTHLHILQLHKEGRDEAAQQEPTAV